MDMLVGGVPKEKKIIFSKTLPTKKVILRVDARGVVRKSFRPSLFFLSRWQGGSDSMIGGVPDGVTLSTPEAAGP